MTSAFARAYARIFICSLIVVAPLSAAGPADDSSVVLKRSAPSADVENGSAYERAEFTLETARRLAVPLDAEVVEQGSGTTIQVLLKKTLGFAGHPPEKMSIRSGRNNLGLASRREGDVLVVGTFGEFGTKEGGANMTLRFVVPKGTPLDRRAELSGGSSSVHKGQDREPRDPKLGYWYGPTTPTKGWTKIETMPDEERTLEKR